MLDFGALQKFEKKTLLIARLAKPKIPSKSTSSSVRETLDAGKVT